jgi:large subunit ribosomal protein L13
MSRRQTYLAKPNELTKTWRIVDASNIPLGRLASEVATILMGKHRPEYTPHVDSGDFVIVTNAKKVALTGRKAEHRLKLRYSQYPGGLKTKPELLVSDAVRRMLPKNRLARVMLKNLMIYEGAEHPHGAHNPTAITVC